MKRGNYLWIFIFIIIILIFVKAFVSTDMMVVSPINKTYNTNSIELNWSADEAVHWCAYSLDSGSNDTSIYSNNITQIFSLVNTTSLNAAFGLKIVGDYAYVGLYDNGDGLTIINISNKSNPVQLSSLINHVSMDYAWGIDVVGDYAYVAASRNDSLTIINVSNKSNPIQLSSFSNSSSLDWARDVQVIGDYAYVVSDGAVGSYGMSLTIINVSNKSNPVQISWLRNSSSMNAAIGVRVIGDYAYVVSDVSDSLTIINVSNKTNITQISSLSNSSSLNGALGIEVIGDYAYVASWEAASFTIINVSDKTNITQISSIANSSSLERAWNVQVIGDYAYVVSTGLWSPPTIFIDGTFTIIDISDKINPVQISSFANFTSMYTPRGGYVLGDYAYVASQQSSSLTILKINQLSNITLSSLSDGLHNVTLFCKNASEDLAQSNYTFFSVDVTAPTVSFSCSPTSVYTGDSIACSCSATDAIDGSPTLTYITNPLTSETGTFSTSCTATDDVNNSVSETLSYTVESAGGSSGNGGNGGSSGGNGIGSEELKKNNSFFENTTDEKTGESSEGIFNIIKNKKIDWLLLSLIIVLIILLIVFIRNRKF